VILLPQPPDHLDYRSEPSGLAPDRAFCSEQSVPGLPPSIATSTSTAFLEALSLQCADQVLRSQCQPGNRVGRWGLQHLCRGLLRAFCLLSTEHAWASVSLCWSS
jgi:hypothetical protein